MRGTKLKIGLDVDDVLMSCIPFLCDTVNTKEGKVIVTPEDFLGWGHSTPATEKVYRYFGDEWFYKNQPPVTRAQEVVAELSKYAELFVISATAPEFMSARAKRVMELFPQIPKENILLGARKDIMELDIMLDDAVHNITTSKAKFPVLMRQPWNKSVSGMLTVNGFDDFLKVVQTIRYSTVTETTKPQVVCLVGPSGSGKHAIADLLEEKKNFSKILSYTTAADERHIVVTPDEFNSLSKDFFETTCYAGREYGLRKSDLDNKLSAGITPVVVTDICGAMRLKGFYDCLLVFVDADERIVIKNILTGQTSIDESVERILSVRDERKNELLCDITVNGTNAEEACADIIKNF